MARAIRLHQFTGLHCDGSDAWKSQFTYVTSCLSDLKPNVIVITGDCVDHPRTSLFHTLATSLRDLCAALHSNGSAPLYLITIPGNHDRFFFGNKFPLFLNRSRKFELHLPSLLYPSGANIQDVI